MRKKIAFGVLGVLLIVGVGGGAFLWLAWEQCGFRGCPTVERLNEYWPEEASVVVDRDGDEVGKLFRIRRVVVPLDSLPDYVPEAFVAVEDRRFWRHNGVDWRRMLGALWANVRAMRIEEGFSTITMQLARNLFPERLPAHEQSVSRKVAEMRVAMEIEERYSKREILELYINEIYYGSGAWGIEAAAQEYFGKPAKRVTLAEAALLAGLPRAPSRLNPRVNPEAAIRRRDLVLQKMARQGRVARRMAWDAMEAPLELSRGTMNWSESTAPYFMGEVRRRLEDELGTLIYTGGYTIHTTLDMGVQRTAEAALAAQLEAIERGRYGPLRHPAYPAGGGEDGSTEYLQGAVVVMDAATGDVRALVGGRDYEDSKFNRATQAKRQPGSAFKPFVYATAFDAGVPPTEPLEDTPLRIVLANGEVWTPGNYGGSYAGRTTVRNALVHSRNVATVRLARRVGLERIIAMAHRLGITTDIPRVPAVALGAAEVTLLDMTAAYAVFATLGRRPRPRLVTKVVDPGGRVIWRRPPRSEEVLDPAVAFLVTDVLQDVVSRGTATRVRSTGYRGIAAGKTGTTNDATDVWFIGYTPGRVAGVWIGLDEKEPILKGATGGELAAPVWARIMAAIGPGTGGRWTPPPGIVRYPVTEDGEPLGPNCVVPSNVRQEYFIAGTVPTQGCPDGRYAPDSLLGVPRGPARDEDEGWWDRLRHRLLGPDSDEPAPDRDSIRILPTPPQARPDTGSRDGSPQGTVPDAPMAPPARPDTPPPSEAQDQAADAGPGRQWSDEDPPELLGRPVQPGDSTGG